MKQLLFLLLFPCLAMAQYQGNGNQKITLGEQTTADGLVYRGVENDTALITPFSDTSAYIILDTINNKFYNYNRATNVWSVAGGGVSVSSFSAGTTGLTPSTATTGAVTLGGTLAVANGGTGSATKNFVDLTTTQSIGGAKTFSLLLTAIGGTTNYNASALPTATISTTTAGAINGVYTSIKIGARGQFGQDQSVAITNVPTADGSSAIAFTTYNNYGYAERMRIASTGNVGIGQTTPTEKLHVVGNARITAMNGINDIGASATGVLQAATSDMNLKNTIEDSHFGLNEILLLNPVTFLYNDENRKIDSDVKEVGFIAQDVFDIIPNAVSSTGTGDLQLDYRAITATLVKAIQEQQAIIKALEQRILILENK